MSRYSQRPSLPSGAKGYKPRSFKMRDSKDLEKKSFSERSSGGSRTSPKNVEVSPMNQETARRHGFKKKTVNGVEVHHDPNDSRPHTIHKVEYTHPVTGEKKTGFFKRVYSSLHDLYQQHLKNKEARARSHELEAKAAIERSEAKKLEAEGKSDVLRAKAERTRARGEAVRNVEEGFGEGVAKSQEQRSTVTVHND